MSGGAGQTFMDRGVVGLLHEAGKTDAQREMDAWVTDWMRLTGSNEREAAQEYNRRTEAEASVSDAERRAEGMYTNVSSGLDRQTEEWLRYLNSAPDTADGLNLNADAARVKRWRAGNNRAQAMGESPWLDLFGG